MIAAETGAAAFLETLAMPSKRLVWFEESAHEPPFEEPDTFNRAIAEFVRSVTLSAALSKSDRKEKT